MQYFIGSNTYLKGVLTTLYQYAALHKGEPHTENKNKTKQTFAKQKQKQNKNKNKNKTKHLQNKTSVFT